MRAGIRIIVCTVLIALAATMATFTIAGFTGRQTPASDSLFTLRGLDGSVAVYSREGGDVPLEVTDIELASLREADRARIENGLGVNSREDLLELLEDLGS